MHSRRQRGRASSSTEKPIHGGPHSVIRMVAIAKIAAQTAANDAMPRAAGGRKSCSSGALPTGKCECRLASSDEAPAEGVKVGEVRCASSRRVLIVRVMTRPAFCDRASTWAAGAVMRSPMVDDSPVSGKQYLISLCESLPEPSFVPAQQGSHEQQAVWLRSAWPQASTSKGAASSKRKSTPQCHTQRAASALNIKAASQGGPRINHPPRSLHWAYTATPGGDHLHT